MTRDNGISLLEMNAANYPSSFNSFASLGAGYKLAGKIDKARASYAKALQLRPGWQEVEAEIQKLK